MPMTVPVNKEDCYLVVYHCDIKNNKWKKDKKDFKCLMRHTNQKSALTQVVLI